MINAILNSDEDEEDYRRRKLLRKDGPGPDDYKNLMRAKSALLDNGDYSDDEERGYNDSRATIDEEAEIAMFKLDTLDTIVEEFVKALNDDSFKLSVLYKRDKIAFRRLSLTEKKNFKQFLLSVIERLTKNYDARKSDELDELFNDEPIYPKINPSAARLNPELRKEAAKLPVDVDIRYNPVDDLEKTEKIATLNDIFTFKDKEAKKLKARRKKVNKILKILCGVETVHPTLKSVNIHYMITQNPPFVTRRDEILTTYNTSTKWSNWSNYNSLWMKLQSTIDIPTSLETFVIKEFFHLKNKDFKQRVIVDLISAHTESLVDNTLLDPVDDDHNISILKKIRSSLMVERRSEDYKTDRDLNKIAWSYAQDKIQKNKRKYLAVVEKIEESVLKQCLNCMQEIAFKCGSFLEKQVKLYIEYCFAGEYVPYVKRSDVDYSEETFFLRESSDKSDFLFDSMITNDSTYIIPNPEHIIVIFHKDTQTYEGRYLPTNAELQFLVDAGNGRFAEQLLALEIKHGGVTARIEDAVKQKPYIIVEVKTENSTKSQQQMKAIGKKREWDRGSAKGIDDIKSYARRGFGKRKRYDSDSDDDDDYIDDDEYYKKKYIREDMGEMNGDIRDLKKKLNKYQMMAKVPRIIRPSTKTARGEGPFTYTLKAPPARRNGDSGGGRRRSSGDRASAPSSSRADKIFSTKIGKEDLYKETNPYKMPRVDTLHPDLYYSTEAEKQEANMRYKTMIFHEKNVADLEKELIKTRQKEDAQRNKDLNSLKTMKETRKTDLGKISEAIKTLETSLKEKQSSAGDDSGVGLLDTEKLTKIVQSGFSDMQEIYKNLTSQLRKVGIMLDSEADSAVGQGAEGDMFKHFNDSIETRVALHEINVHEKIFKAQILYNETTETLQTLLANINTSGSDRTHRVGGDGGIGGASCDPEIAAIIDGGGPNNNIYDPSTVNIQPPRMSESEFDFLFKKYDASMSVIQARNADGEGGCDPGEGTSDGRVRKRKGGNSNGGGGRNGGGRKSDRSVVNASVNMVSKQAFDDVLERLRNMDLFSSKLIKMSDKLRDMYNKALGDGSKAQLELDLRKKQIGDYQKLIKTLQTLLNSQIRTNKMEIGAFKIKFDSFIESVAQQMRKQAERNEEQNSAITSLRQNLVESSLVRLNDINEFTDSVNDDATSATSKLILLLKEQRQDMLDDCRRRFEEAQTAYEEKTGVSDTLRNRTRNNYINDRYEDRARYNKAFKANEADSDEREKKNEVIMNRNNMFIRDLRTERKNKINQLSQQPLPLIGQSGNNSGNGGGGSGGSGNSSSNNNGTGINTAGVGGGDGAGGSGDGGGGSGSDGEGSGYDSEDSSNRRGMGGDGGGGGGRRGLPGSHLNGPINNLDQIQTLNLNDMTLAERDAVTKATALLVDDEKVAKAVENAHLENREAIELERQKTELELQKKIEERRYARDMNRILSVKKNFDKVRTFDCENSTVTAFKRELGEDVGIKPQIIELKEGQIYRSANFGRPAKYIEKIQINCAKAWFNAVKHYFPVTKKVHETGAKIVYPNYSIIYSKYVVPTLQLLYGRNLDSFRIDDKSVLFTNQENRFAFFFKEMLDNEGEIGIYKQCEMAVRNRIKKLSIKNQ